MPEFTVHTRFKVNQQRLGKWCWAAITEGIAQYYSPGSEWTQCSVVKKYFGVDDCGEDRGESSPYNKVGYLHLALNLVGNLSGNTDENRAFDPTQTGDIVNGIKKSHPIGMRISRPHGSHFVAISGVKTDQNETVEEICVCDPEDNGRGSYYQYVNGAIHRNGAEYPITHLFFTQPKAGDSVPADTSVTPSIDLSTARDVLKRVVKVWDADKFVSERTLSAKTTLSRTVLLLNDEVHGYKNWQQGDLANATIEDDTSEAQRYASFLLSADSRHELGQQLAKPIHWAFTGVPYEAFEIRSGGKRTFLVRQLSQAGSSHIQLMDLNGLRQLLSEEIASSRPLAEQ